jgi:hypothetical protein
LGFFFSRSFAYMAVVLQEVRGRGRSV